jgi:hypothetical protein
LAPSSDPCLLALFHTRSAHGVRPSELFSTRAAARRCPTALPSCRCAELSSHRPSPHDSRAETQGPHEAASVRIRLSPRLQGFDPHGSPPHERGGLARRPARSSPGPLAPPGVSPSLEWQRLSPPPPLMSFFLRWFPAFGRLFRVLLPARLACLSRGCLPSWGFPPFDLPRKFRSPTVRESPPRVPGCVAVPCSNPL